MTFTPAYKISFGPKQESGGIGIPGGPTLSLGGAAKVIDTSDDPQTSTVVDLRVSLSMDTPADSATLLLGRVGNFVPEHEGTLSIALGFADSDDLSKVMTSTIVTRETGLIHTRVTGHSAAQRLLHTFHDEMYEDRNAGQIVRDLANKAQVNIATAHAGIQFPAYVIDSRRSVYVHMRALAKLSGFDLYINSNGDLVFEPFRDGKTIHKLVYAQHVLVFELQQSVNRAKAIEAWGESPGGSKSKDDWAWLTKDFAAQAGKTGSGVPKLLLENPALRNRSAANKASDALAQRLQRQTQRGRVTTIGNAKIQLGDALEFEGLPDSSANGKYQVRAVKHYISKAKGFLTTVDFRSI